MTGKEFVAFLKTPQGKMRAQDFGKLDGCDEKDFVIIAECGKEQAKNWKKELNHTQYLRSMRKESGRTVFSYHGCSFRNRIG